MATDGDAEALGLYEASELNPTFNPVKPPRPLTASLMDRFTDGASTRVTSARPLNSPIRRQP